MQSETGVPGAVKLRALCDDQCILLNDAAAQLIDLVRERAKTGELILEKGVIFAPSQSYRHPVERVRGGKERG